MGNSVVRKLAVFALKGEGFTADNTFFADSISPDEIMHEAESLPVQLEKAWGASSDTTFHMGGLGGVPFSGAAGFDAFASHVPDDGNAFILMGPQVPIDADGMIGSAVDMSEMEVVVQHPDMADLQMTFIARQLFKNKAAIENADPQTEKAQLAKAMYAMVENQMLNIVTDVDGELAILGGIQINMPGPYEDFFQPLFFKVKESADSEWKDFLPRMLAENVEAIGRIPGPFPTAIWQGGWTPTTGPVAEALEALPPSYPSGSVVSKSSQILRDLGFIQSTTVYGQSISSDEINHSGASITKAMQSVWGKVYHMGGFSGMPFTGKAGFNAFSTHAPEDGNLIVMFAPHVGISPNGVIGKVFRNGQASSTTACGAAMAAYDALISMDAAELEKYVSAGSLLAKGRMVNEEMLAKLCAGGSMQMEYLMTGIANELESIKKSADPMVELTNVMYELAEKQILDMVSMDGWSGPDSKLALLGGVVVNMPKPYEDFFVPMHFTVQDSKGNRVNLLGQLMAEL